MHLLATRLLGLPIVCLACAATVGAQQTTAPTVTAVPRLVRITGSFRPADGLPPAPVEIVTLAIYAEESGGTPLWQETQNVAIDAKGTYTIVLGSTQPDGLPHDLFATGDRRWLAMHVERAGESDAPRVRLTSVPYALRASDADTLGGRPASAYVLAPTSDETASEKLPSATPGPSSDIIVSGTPGFLAKYTSATDVSNSAVFESGGLVGIGTTVPLDTLHIVYNNTNGAMTGFAVQNLGNTSASYSGMLFYDQFGALGQFQGFNNVTHEYRINNIASGGSINFMIGSSSKFRVGNNGAIGIDAPTGTAKLTVKGSPGFTATGTVSTTTGSGALTGIGTKFLTELSVGDRVTVAGFTSAVFQVTSDTSALLSNAPANNSGVPMTILPAIFRAQNSAGGIAFQVNDVGTVSIGSSLTGSNIKLYVSDGNRFTGTTTPASLSNGNVTIATTNTEAADVGGVLALGGSRGTTGISSFGGIRGGKENSTDTEPSGYLGLYTVDSSSTFAEKMRVTSTGLVGIGTKVPARELEVNGGVRLNTATAKPACDATIRGTFWVTQGGAGVKDAVEVCAKDATDVFAWRTLF
jgi:hypothetical protein